MAVKGSLAVGLSRPANMRTDLGDNGSSKGDVGNEMAIHDIDMEPVRPLVHLGRAFLAELREIGAEDGGSYNGGGTHGGGWKTEGSGNPGYRPVMRERRDREQSKGEETCSSTRSKSSRSSGSSSGGEREEMKSPEFKNH